MDQVITVDECTLEECGSVLQVWDAAGSAKSVTDTVEVLGRLVKDSGGLFLVAHEGATVVGSIIGGWDGWRGHIYRLAVLPSHRRQGIAERLTVGTGAPAHREGRRAHLCAGGDGKAPRRWVLGLSGC